MCTDRVQYEIDTTCPYSGCTEVASMHIPVGLDLLPVETALAARWLFGLFLKSMYFCLAGMSGRRVAMLRISVRVMTRCTLPVGFDRVWERMISTLVRKVCVQEKRISRSLLQCIRGSRLLACAREALMDVLSSGDGVSHGLLRSSVC